MNDQIAKSISEIDLANRSTENIDQIVELSREHGTRVVGNLLIQGICARFTDGLISFYALLVQTASVVELMDTTDDTASGSRFKLSESEHFRKFLQDFKVGVILDFRSFCEKLKQEEENATKKAGMPPVNLQLDTNPYRLWKTGHLHMPIILILKRLSSALIGDFDIESPLSLFGRNLSILLSLNNRIGENRLHISTEELYILSTVIEIIFERLSC